MENYYTLRGKACEKEYEQIVRTPFVFRQVNLLYVRHPLGGFFFGCRLWRGGVWSLTTSGGSRSFFVCRMDIEKNIGMWYNNDKGEEALCIA